MKNIKAVIFDFNGTMIFDSDLHRRVWYDFIPKYTGNVVPYDELRDFVLGRDTATILRHYLGEGLSEGEISRLTYEKEAAYRRLCLEDTEKFKFVDGLREFLDYLKASGLPMNIATGSEIMNLRFYFENLGLASWFDFEKVVYDDGSFPGKPAPDIYLRAAAALCVAPADCLVFEDSLSGVLAAHNAGIGHIVGISEQDGAAFYDSVGGVKFASDSFREYIGFLELKS